MKPGKAVKKTMGRTDVECARLNLDVFFFFPDTPGLLESSTNIQTVVTVFVRREKVDQGFIDACIYVKDRMEEVSSPDKEMVRISFWLF